MAHFGKTVRELRDGLRLTQDELADKVGVGRAIIQVWERAPTSQMHQKNYRKLAEVFGMTPDELDRRWRATKIKQTKGQPGMIPVINRAPAGKALNYEEYGVDSGQAPDYIPTPTRLIGQELLFAFEVVGDSMSPRFSQGDVIICRPLRPDEKVEDGTPVFVRFSSDLDDGCTFKRVYDLGDRIELRPDNPRHKPQLVKKVHVERMAKAIMVQTSLE